MAYSFHCYLSKIGGYEEFALPRFLGTNWFFTKSASKTGKNSAITDLKLSVCKSQEKLNNTTSPLF